MKNETAIFILLKSLTSHAFHPSRYFLLSSLLLHLSLRRIIVVHSAYLLALEKPIANGTTSSPFPILLIFPFTETNDLHFLLSSKSIRIIVAIRYRFGSFLSCAYAGRVELCRCEPFTCLELPPFVDASKSSVSNSCRKVNNFKAAFVIVY